MVSAKCFVLLAIVALATNNVTATQLLQASSCPLPADANLDLVTPCGSNSTICTDCLCTLTIALVPAFVAGGVTFDPENPSSLDISAISGIATVCAPQIAAALGDKAALLTGLTGCPLVRDSAAGNTTDTSLPACLTVEKLTAAFAAANSTVSLNTTDGITTNSTAEDSANGIDGMSLDSNTTSTNTTGNTSTVTAQSGSTDAAGASDAAGTSSGAGAGSSTAASSTKSAATVAGVTAMATVGAAALAALLL